MVLAAALLLIVVASVLFHFISPWWFTEIASNWGLLDDTIDITMVITGVVFVVINLFIAYTVIRFRHREGHRAHYEPENKKLEWWLTGATSLGIVAMLAPGLYVYSDMITVPADATTVEVMSQQWQWRYRLPGQDGALGVTDTRHMEADNPFGVNPDDPRGQDDVLVDGPELHIPVGQPVKVLLRATDVLHNFYVPQFRAKMDMVPGLVSYFWFTPTRTGRFEVLCAELCGVGHFNMRGHVVVDEEPAYRTWLAGQTTFAAAKAQAGAAATGDPKALEGKQLAQTRGCAACHSPDGKPGIGPTWKGLYGKTQTLTGGATVKADEVYLKQSITNPGAAVVQGFAAVMPQAPLSEQEVAALIAYIKSLGGEPAARAGQQEEGG